jgi:hypothetical protein
MKNLSGKNLDITKSILEWLRDVGCQKSVDTLLEETKLSSSDIPKTKSLEKKWTTIMIMQKKLIEMENKMKSMKEEYEQSSLTGVSYNKKDNSSSGMVRKFNYFNIHYNKKHSL